jgi:hypothetical protein
VSWMVVHDTLHAVGSCLALRILTAYLRQGKHSAGGPLAFV